MFGLKNGGRVDGQPKKWGEGRWVTKKMGGGYMGNQKYGGV